MQSLKDIFINGAMILALLFGLTVSATAEGPSFEEVKVLAEQGDSFYQAYLGDHYSEGRGVRQDYVKAFYWYKKSADQGDSTGQFNVAYAYETGKGVRQDYVKSFEMAKKSADQGNAISQSYLGSKYESGKGVRQNKIIAKELHGKSCDNGYQYGCDNYRRMNEQGR